MINAASSSNNTSTNNADASQRQEVNAEGNARDAKIFRNSQQKNTELESVSEPSRRLAQNASNEVRNDGPEGSKTPPKIREERDLIQQERDRIQQERDRIQLSDDYTNSPINADQPRRSIGADNEKFQALNDVYSFSNNVGFEDFRVREEYRTTLESLYDESPTFKDAIDKLQAEGDKITLVRTDNLKFSGQNLGAVAASIDNYKNTALNSVPNKNDPDQGVHYYDPDTNRVSFNLESSLARNLVHETMHAAQDGLEDDAIQPDYIKEVKSHQAGRDLIDAFSNVIDPNGTNGEPKSEQEIELEAIRQFAPGPIVRLTNEVLSESITHRENPRLTYLSSDPSDREFVELLGGALSQLVEEDFAADGKYDLF